MIKTISTHLFLYNPLSRETIDIISRNNFQFLEIWAMKPHFEFDNRDYLKQIADIISSHGIKVISFHGPLYEDISDAMKGRWLSLASKDGSLRRRTLDLFKRVVDAMEFFNCNTIITHTGLSGDINEEEMENLFYSLQEILDHCNGMALNIALENGVSSSASISSILTFMEKYPSLKIGICLDTGHAHISGNFSQNLEAMVNYLMTIHIHDNKGFSDEHLLPFHGTIPWGEMLKILSRKGYRGPFVYELRDQGGSKNEMLLREINRIHEEFIRIINEYK